MLTRNQADLRQLQNGLVKAAGWILLIVTTSLLIGGTVFTFFPHLATVDDMIIPISPQIAGIGFLLAGVLIVYLTERRWVSYLSGFLAYGVFGGLLALIAGPHGRLAIPRWGSLLLTLMMLAASFVASTFKDRVLGFADRALLLATVLTFTGAIGVESGRRLTGQGGSDSITVIGAGAALFCLVTGWAFHRLAGKRSG